MGRDVKFRQWTGGEVCKLHGGWTVLEGKAQHSGKSDLFSLVLRHELADRFLLASWEVILLSTSAWKALHI